MSLPTGRIRLAAGHRLGHYEIVDAIGAGGMGEVYKARDTRLDRTVAIKVLPADVAHDPQARERFEREARAVAALNHPHICALYDVGEAMVASRPPRVTNETVRYLVMEYLEGETLADRLARPKGRLLSVHEALTIALDLAAALDRAHRAGVVTASEACQCDADEAGAKHRLRSHKATGPLRGIGSDGGKDLTAPGLIVRLVRYMARSRSKARMWMRATSSRSAWCCSRCSPDANRSKRAAMPASAAIPNAISARIHPSTARRCTGPHRGDLPGQDRDDRWQQLAISSVSCGGSPGRRARRQDERSPFADRRRSFNAALAIRVHSRAGASYFAGARTAPARPRSRRSADGLSRAEGIRRFRLMDDRWRSRQMSGSPQI